MCGLAHYRKIKHKMFNFFVPQPLTTIPQYTVIFCGCKTSAVNRWQYSTDLKKPIILLCIISTKIVVFSECNGSVQILSYERWLQWRGRVHYHCSLKTYFLFATLSKVNINIFLFTIKMDQRELRSLVWYMIK